MGFKKAIKTKLKLRMNIPGVSGAGKTYTALGIATGMSDKIALIDSEFASASLYAGIFNFDVFDISRNTHPKEYINAINEAEKLGYEVLIIDSITQAWETTRLEVDKAKIASKSGNSYIAWNVGTKLWNDLIARIKSSSMHIIVTSRSKMSYEQTDENGKKQIKKVGLAPEMREGSEYAFDLSLEMNIDHFGSVIKTRFKKLDKKIIEEPGEEFGKELILLLNDGKEIKKETASIETLNKLNNLLKMVDVKDETIANWCETEKVSSINDFIEEQAQKYIRACEKQLQKQESDIKIALTAKIMDIPETKNEEEKEVIDEKSGTKNETNYDEAHRIFK